MSTANVETRYAMATKRVVDYPSSYLNHHHHHRGGSNNGLIKSASTSSCSANENALLKTLRASRYATNGGKKLAFSDTEMAASLNERLKLFVLQPIARSEQNTSFIGAAAADADFLSAGPKNVFRSGSPIRGRSPYTVSKHFSDCEVVGYAQQLSPTLFAGKTEAAAAVPRVDFESHRNLDNVLVRKDAANCSILNFASVNDNNNASSSRGTRMRSAMEPAASTSSRRKVDITVSSLCDALSRMNTSTASQSVAVSVPQSTLQQQQQLPTSPLIHVSALVPPSSSASLPQTEFNDSGCGHDADNVTQPSADSRSNSSGGDDDNAVAVAADDDAAKETPQKSEKRFRRSSSLKIPKETTENQAQKKIVRFADALGLDLTDVRTFLDELPSVPKSAYSDLCPNSGVDHTPLAGTSADRSFGSRPQQIGAAVAAAVAAKCSLVPMFKQPGISHNFLERIRDNNVCLERAVVSSQPVCSISGTVRVRNIDFHKSVYVRYTLDNWRSFAEAQAIYVPDSCDGFSDQFSFIIYLYEVPSSQRVELAVRYHCSGSIFWDNNTGANYVFQSSSSPPTIPSYFTYMQTTNDRCHSFY